jgi:hypothetical protein
MKMPIENGDVICVAESVVARAEGNYVTVDDIAREVSEKFGNNEIALVHPVLSMNRFSMILRGICRGAKGGVILALSLPADEFGNHILAEEKYLSSPICGYRIVSEKFFRANTERKDTIHPFTGIDYIEYYKSIAKEENCKMMVVFTNKPATVLDLSKHVLCCDIRTRELTKNLLMKNGAAIVYSLDEICNVPNQTTGFNARYGLLGSNKADDEKLKLLPRNPEFVTSMIQHHIYDKTVKTVEVIAYSDFPVKGIAYTKGLYGKIKIASLADLMSAGGRKTQMVWVKGY